MKLEELVIGDEKLFRRFVDRYRPSDNLHFEDSWAYTLQATRNWPRKLTDGDSLFLFSKKVDGTLVIPNYFSPNKKLIDLVKGLRQNVILKNVDLRDVERLRERGFSVYSESEHWSAEFPYDDQTFPQQILDIDKLMSLKGKNYAVLRRDLHYSRRNTGNLTMRKYEPRIDKEKVVILAKLQEERNFGTLDAHRLFFDISTSSSLLSLVFEINGEIVGFTLIDRISNTCIAYNALIYDTKVPQLASRLTYESARVAYERGYTFFNLQGSETANLDRWKRKFNPAKAIHKTHLIYRSE